MDPHFLVTREEFQDVQMDVKRIATLQQHHSERLRLLEKRQADDAQLRSVWNSPFPSVLGGTPQHGPVHIPPNNDVFDDLDADEQSQSLLQSIHLDAVEDEPIRRGAASRANSVRFDESALQSSNWGHQNRHSGDFGPIRPTSGLGTQMERSLSHKSDGRHSSAGHSVYSVHSGVSGRASSLGLDTNFVVGGHEDDESPLDIPEPPPGYFYSGSAPAIIRCWVAPNFASDTLLYAVVCTGSQRSTIEYSLLRELDLLNSIHREADGVPRISLPIFLAEARVTQPNSRSPSPAPQLPSMTCSFEVTGLEMTEGGGSRKSLRIFIGSHTLRLHSADLLFSQNLMTLYGTDRDKLSVPFVRPEDDSLFKNIATTNLVPEKPRLLNAAAREFIAGEKSSKSDQGSGDDSVVSHTMVEDAGSGPFSPASTNSQMAKANNTSDGTINNGLEGGRHAEVSSPQEHASKDPSAASDGQHRRDSTAAIRTPWRQTGTANGNDSGQRDNAPLSGYQPASRPRGMKILKPSKPSSTSARTGAAYEPAPASRTSGEFRSKSGESLHSIAAASSVSGSGSGGGALRWGEQRRYPSTASLANENIVGKPGSAPPTGDGGKVAGPVRTANNPLGNASAFSFLSGSKPKASTTAAE